MTILDKEIVTEQDRILAMIVLLSMRDFVTSDQDRWTKYREGMPYNLNLHDIEKLLNIDYEVVVAAFLNLQESEWISQDERPPDKESPL